MCEVEDVEKGYKAKSFVFLEDVEDGHVREDERVVGRGKGDIVGGAEGAGAEFEEGPGCDAGALARDMDLAAIDGESAWCPSCGIRVGRR